MSCVPLINCQKSGYPTGWEFLHMQIFCKNGMHYFLRKPYRTSYASFCNSSVTQNISWTLVTISGVVSVRGLPKSGSTSRLSLSCLNSATIPFIVACEVTFFLSVATITAWIALVRTFLCKYLLPCFQQNPCVLFTVTCYHFNICWPNNTGCWLHNCNKASQAIQIPRTRLLRVGKRLTGEFDDI